MPPAQPTPRLDVALDACETDRLFEGDEAIGEIEYGPQLLQMMADDLRTISLEVLEPDDLRPILPALTAIINDRIAIRNAILHDGVG